MMITGTSHFVSRVAAIRYYAVYGYGPADVDRKIAGGEIHIGRPQIKSGQRLVKIDDCQRYGIEE